MKGYFWLHSLLILRQVKWNFDMNYKKKNFLKVIFITFPTIFTDFQVF